MTHAEIEAFLGVKLGAIVAGFAGAVISLAYDRKLSPAGAFFALIAGLACAAFLPPLLGYWWPMPRQVENSIAFCLGLGGLTITGKIYRAIKRIDLPTALRGKVDKEEDK